MNYGNTSSIIKQKFAEMNHEEFFLTMQENSQVILIVIKSLQLLNSAPVIVGKRMEYTKL